jgi:hypothetical protein
MQGRRLTEIQEEPGRQVGMQSGRQVGRLTERHEKRDRQVGMHARRSSQEDRQADGQTEKTNR